MMHRSHFFHRDEADAFYTDRYEDDAPDVTPDCPICDRPLDELQTGLYCPDCNVAYDDLADIERVRADLRAGPFHEDAHGYNTTVAEGLTRWTR